MIKGSVSGAWCPSDGGVCQLRFSFNGQEKDDEISGNGNSYTAECWEYDSRLGRRWNRDPILTGSQSCYAAFNNNPLVYIDPDGRYSKFGAWWRSKVNNGEGVHKSGNEWGYNIKTYDENGKVDGTASVYGKQNYKSANNLSEVLGRSLLTHDDYIKLTGQLLDKIKQDPDMRRYDQELISQVKEDKRYGLENFTITPRKELVTFGGFTDDPLNPFDPATQTVALNELTWVTRHANVYANIEVQKDGTMGINYLLEDRLDLYPRASGSLGYNAVCLVTGTIYHIGLGGTASKIKAKWTKKVK